MREHIVRCLFKADCLRNEANAELRRKLGDAQPVAEDKHVDVSSIDTVTANKTLKHEFEGFIGQDLAQATRHWLVVETEVETVDQTLTPHFLHAQWASPRLSVRVWSVRSTLRKCLTPYFRSIPGHDGKDSEYLTCPCCEMASPTVRTRHNDDHSTLIPASLHDHSARTPSPLSPCTTLNPRSLPAISTLTTRSLHAHFTLTARSLHAQ